MQCGTVFGTGSWSVFSRAESDEMPIQANFEPLRSPMATQLRAGARTGGRHAAKSKGLYLHFSSLGLVLTCRLDRAV